MPALQVKDFPDDLYEELRECAAEECRSVSQQTVYVLRQFLRWRKAYGSLESALWAAPLVSDLLVDEEEAKRAARLAKRRRILERIDKRGTVAVSEDFPDPVELIRQMRDERSDQILQAVGDLEAMRKAEAKHDCA